MAEKNRFSRLLKYLLSVSDVKNYTLAQELQYDVSYISKWTSGQMIPSEKNEEKIIRGISECVVEGCGKSALDKLMSEYQVDNKEDLKLALFDNLEAEYVYVKNLQSNSGVDVAPQLFFYPELKLADYISKMKHPVLRRVNALDIVSAIDIFAMGRQYRSQVVETERKHVPKGKWYQDVHYSMIIDVRLDRLNYIYDVFFLVDLLERNSCINFQLYGTPHAAGKVVFTVKNDYAISGMLVAPDRCMSVVITEVPEECQTLYRNLQSMCGKDRLLFRKTSMASMLLRHEYVHALFALRQQWIIGHLTEHFLPDDLFEEIVQELFPQKEVPYNEEGVRMYPEIDELRNIHRITKNAVEEFKISILIYRTGLYNLLVEHELDFFNYKIRLTDAQVVRYLENFLDLCTNHPNLEIKMVPNRLITDVEYNTRPCIFLSDTISYLRLNVEFNNLYVLNRGDMREAFGIMFSKFWNDKNGILITEKEKIIANVEQVISGLRTSS